MPDEVFLDHYEKGPLLGKGHFGVVYSCTDKHGTTLAVKHIEKAKLTPTQLKDAVREVKLMKVVAGHKHIARCVRHYETEMELDIVMELVEGGELFDQIVKQKHYSEADAAVVAHNILTALDHMHSRNVTHRDLKPENILLSDKSDITNIKIIDFGFAASTPPLLEQCCGTPLYIAPEVLNCGLFKTGGPYSTECDVWSAGVIIYILLCGFPPFRGRSTNEQFKNIVRGVYAFPPNRVWGVITDSAKDLISKLLVLDPADRLSAREALQHPWLEGRSTAPDANLEETVTNLKEFNAVQQWRKGIFGVEAITRLQYAASCKELSLKPNSEIVKIFTEATTTVHSLDLSKNYIGAKGLMALLPLVRDNDKIQTVILGNNGINNAVMEKFCQVLRKHPSLTSVDLSDNPISHMSGRYLLNALQTNTSITTCTLEGTAIMESTLKKIALQVDRNVQLQQQKS
eukprot:TRINITY_DN24132_c0_g1_i1.p1 TRINITY_DN24132_c0_g1~~TRINITY_DN24132_c0_g1_i1.p1  ORF type:complete len:472 (+),score=110.09 TRINITY_DN24132_c0_g1_i1:44-1417(+)